VLVCPPRRPQRKGAVEAAIRYLTRSWWRTAAVTGLGDAQAGVDRFCERVADTRARADVTVGERAAQERLRELPREPFAVELRVERVVGRSALVAFEGNRYSVPPAYLGQPVEVRARLGAGELRILSASGLPLAAHRRAPAGAGQVIRSAEHHILLEHAVLEAFTTRPPCRPKTIRPPGEQALAELARQRGLPLRAHVRDLADYAAIAARATELAA
jgi:hypothetical protein